MIFVFGSNLAGRHGAGAAAYAVRNCGAVFGIGEGPQGQAYAIPTKDADIRTLPVDEIAQHVDLFIAYAQRHGGREFMVTAIGTGLAGYSHAHIAPLFYGAPSNCLFDERWTEFLPAAARFWGNDAARTPY